MRISELPRGLKELAELRRSQCLSKNHYQDSDYLRVAFDWLKTKERFKFWFKISTGNFSPFYNCKVVNLKYKPVTEPDPGYLEGEICNRDGCKGIIEDPGKDGGCYCCATPMPPCSYCTEQNQYCPECGWEAENA